MRPIKEDKGRVRPVVEDDFQCDENGNSTRIYEVLSIVGYAKADGTKLGYISKTNVPIGIPITDTKYWYPFQVIGVPKGDKGDKGDRGDDGKSAYDLYIEHGGTITPVEAWIASLQGKDGRNGRDGRDGVDGKDGINGRDGKDGKDGKDGRPLQLRISSDGQSIEISSDGGETWYIFEKNFSKLRVLGYIDSISDLPRNANIGDIYGVRIPDEEVEEEYTYNLYINTVTGWNLDYTITKVYDYDTELPSSAANGTTVLVPVDYLTLDKTKIDGYKVYRFSLEKNGWVLILDTAEIYASKEDIINHGDNVYALVQGDEENTYKLYKRVVGWVYFGTNASITYVLVQDVNEGTETNILSGKAVTDAYGRYIESPEFVRAYLDSEDKILWGIKTDGTVYFGAGVPPQVKDYIEERIGNYDDITTFLDDLEEGDETLRELLNEKVDKEEGKSLIDEEYAEGVHYIESPEFVEVKLDQDDRILEAIMPDGTKLLPAGYEVGGNIVKTISNPEYLAAWLDGANHILFALKADGDVIFGCGIPSQIKDHVNELIKPFEELFHYEDNPEFIDVKLDSEGKILEGIKANGTKYLGSLDINGITYSIVSNPEWLKAVVDSDNKIICGIKTDGVFWVVDINFFDSSNKVKDVLSRFDVKDNPEFLSVELDSNKKILGGRKIDGTKFENIGLDLGGATLKSTDDPEGRIEIKTDFNSRLISYRKEDGTIVENVGIETNHLELTDQGMSDFQQALKDAGFNPGGTGDWSDNKELQIPEPRCAMINIIGNMDLENLTKKGEGGAIEGYNYDVPMQLEFFDFNGNYFKKWILISAQGRSSLRFKKKGLGFDILNGNPNDPDFDEDDTFLIKFGDWVPQDSFHCKSFYTDYFRCLTPVIYKLADEVFRTHGILNDRPYKRYFTDQYTDSAETNGDNFKQNAETGAMCIPAGFPCIVYKNGSFWGVNSWQLKKHRDNYYMEKDNADHIHIDSDKDGNHLWFRNGVIDWGTSQASGINNKIYGLEIRNPKDLYCIDGTKYDADVNAKEIITTATANAWIESGILPTGEEITNKIRKRLIVTGKTRARFEELTTFVPILYNMDQGGSTSEDIRNTFKKYFDLTSFIDVFLLHNVTYNQDGFGNNTQVLTWGSINDTTFKWFVVPYDCDVTFGYMFLGTDSDPANGNILMGNDKMPYYYLWKYFKSEIKARYKELRDAKIFDADHIIQLFRDWMDRVGYDNYQKEWEKWPDSPCNRDGSATYPDEPTTGGFYGSIYSLYNYIVNRIDFLDAPDKFDYNN